MQIVSLASRRRRIVPMVVGAVLLVGSAAHAASTTLLVNPGPNAAEPPFAPTSWVDHATEQLRGEAASWLGGALMHPPLRVTDNAFNATAEMLRRTGTTLTGPQVVLIVDRAPSVQRLWLVLYDQSNPPWPVIAAVKVSTGKPGRKEHFRTPIGVFTNTPAIFGYRAQGTLNENGIRGNGIKGMRVWDFGWQTTDDWRTSGAITSIRLEMHATDPTFLASRLGRPDFRGLYPHPRRIQPFPRPFRPARFPTDTAGPYRSGHRRTAAARRSAVCIRRSYGDRGRYVGPRRAALRSGGSARDSNALCRMVGQHRP